MTIQPSSLQLLLNPIPKKRKKENKGSSTTFFQRFFAGRLKSEMNTWHQVQGGCMANSGTIGKAKHKAFIEFFAAVYLLTGPMLLGTPAREGEKEQLKSRHVTEVWGFNSCSISPCHTVLSHHQPWLSKLLSVACLASHLFGFLWFPPLFLLWCPCC